MSVAVQSQLVQTIVPTDLTSVDGSGRARERLDALPLRIEVGFDIEYST